MADGLHVIRIEQQDPRLGRHVVHDPRSRNFAFRGAEAPKRKFRHRLYNPRPNLNQPRGNCTGCAACMVSNAAGNRVAGSVLGMGTADKIYSRATELDPWPGSWPPSDTGSSGLAAAQAAVELGIASHYEWVFGGHDELLAAVAVKPVSIGTWWYEGQMRPDPETLMIRPTGRKVGGHQFILYGWDPYYQAYDLHCWWNGWGDKGRARIHKDDVAALRADDGDVHLLHRARV